MENENKELDLETQDTGATVDEPDFDPTESEDFYNNLEAAISGEIAVEEAVVPAAQEVPSLYHPCPLKRNRDRTPNRE